MATKFELKRKGGEWLAAARIWMQWNCLNGSRVTWGSHETLQTKFGCITVQQIEDLAATVAAAAIQEYEKKKSREEIRLEILDNIIMRG
jgi:hypothetical protein